MVDTHSRESLGSRNFERQGWRAPQRRYLLPTARRILVVTVRYLTYQQLRAARDGKALAVVLDDRETGPDDRRTAQPEYVFGAAIGSNYVLP